MRVNELWHETSQIDLLHVKLMIEIPPRTATVDHGGGPNF